MYNLSISGLQEECPLLNESATVLLTKLQCDNQLLRYKIEKLLSEKDGALHSFKDIQSWECGAGTKFKNQGKLHLLPSFQAGILKQALNSEMNTLHGSTIGSQRHTSENSNRYEDEVRNVAKKYSDGHFRGVPFVESSEYVTAIKCEDENAVKQSSGMKVGNVPFDASSEYVMLAEDEDALGAVNVPDIEISRDSVNDFTDHVDDGTFLQFRDHDGITDAPVALSDARNVAESSVLSTGNEAVVNFLFVTKDEEDFAESSVKDDGVAQPAVQVKDEVFAFSVRDRDGVLDHTVSTHFPGGDSAVKVNGNVNYLQSKMIQDMYDWEEYNVKVIKSTLKLLQTQFEDNIMSPDTGSILSSSVALATELEQSLVHLQNSITQCKVQKSDLCAHFQKRMELSVSKLKETAEGLVDDIDEQMYKLLKRIARKLKKCRGNLQDKWCHLTNKYSCESDAVCNWLNSSVLLDCKESDRQTKRKLNQFSYEGSDKLNAKVVRSTSDKKKKGTDVPSNNLKINIMKEEYDGFKSVDSDTASDADQKNIIHYTLTQAEHQPDSRVLQSSVNEDHEVIINHDSLNEQHLEMNIPMTVSKAFEKPSGQEQYMSELYKEWKHDSQGTFKTHFSKKEKNKYENKHKNVPWSKTCQQTYNGETGCQKFKNDQQFLHSQKFKGVYFECGHEDNQWCAKRNWKNEINNKDKKEYKKQEVEHSLHDKNKYHRQSVILEGVTLVNTGNPKQNVSGDWLLKMANARAEHRWLEHRSDWLFDRADARKLKRQRHHVAGNWYFQRARGREYCRYYPNSDWCKTAINSVTNYDWLHQSNYEYEYSENNRLHHSIRWSKKFVPRSFATAGKWMKDSFSKFSKQNKFA
jgi:hypothetical protein